MNAEPREVKLAGLCGVDLREIEQVVKVLLGQGPMLVWCEPVPTATRQSGFVGLWKGPAAGLSRQLQAGVRIEEARLFWPKEALHLCRGRDGKGTRWSVIWEDPIDKVPGWLATLGGVVESEPPGTFEAHEQTILTRRDFDRYLGKGTGKPASEWPEKLNVVEYRRGTRRVFWRAEEAK